LRLDQEPFLPLKWIVYKYYSPFFTVGTVSKDVEEWGKTWFSYCL